MKGVLPAIDPAATSAYRAQFTLAKLLDVALSAGGRIGHSKVGLVKPMLLADTHVAINTADLLEWLAFVQKAHRTQIVLDFSDHALLVGTGIRVRQLADFIQIVVIALRPAVHPSWGDSRVTLHALRARCIHLGISRRLVEIPRVEVLGYWDGFPELRKRSLSGTGGRIVVALGQRVVEFFG